MINIFGNYFELCFFDFVLGGMYKVNFFKGDYVIDDFCILLVSNFVEVGDYKLDFEKFEKKIDGMMVKFKIIYIGKNVGLLFFKNVMFKMLDEKYYVVIGGDFKEILLFLNEMVFIVLKWN